MPASFRRPHPRTSHGATSTTGVALRLGRGAVVGVMVVGLASAAHTSAGGSLALPTLIGLLAGCIPLGVALSRREWGLGRLLAVLIGTQAGIHVLLAATAAHSMSAAGGAGHSRPAPGLVSGMTPGMTGHPAMPAAVELMPMNHALLPDAEMLTNHAVAVPLTAGLLRWGEYWLLLLLAALAAGLTRLPDAVRTVPGSPRLLGGSTRPPFDARPMLLTREVLRRGPPAFC